MLHAAVKVPVMHSRETSLCIWQLLGVQRQAYNRGVDIVVKAVENDQDVPSCFDIWKLLTQARRSKRMPADAHTWMPADVPLAVQRAGIAAGRKAAKSWNDARLSHIRDVEYWTTRQKAASLDASGDHKAAKHVRKQIKGTTKRKHKDTTKEVQHCETRLSKVVQNQERHTERGTKRLFRTLKDIQSKPSRMPALQILQGTKLLPRGKVRLPGGLVLQMRDADWQMPEDCSWTGAVQVIDVTTRVTATTRPEHRKYALHVQLRKKVDEPTAPESVDDIRGVDAGVVVNIAVSDGRALNLPEETLSTRAIKVEQQRRAKCNIGSRKWKQRSRKIKRLHQRRTNRRDNAVRHIARDVVSTPNIKAVGAEITNSKKMMASAAGTVSHPGTNVAQKRGLNRSLHNNRFAGLRKDIERACLMRGVHYVEVPAAGTSQKCHRCGAKGQRESQAKFLCVACNRSYNADYNAAVNIAALAWSAFCEGLVEEPGDRGGRRKRVKRRGTTSTLPPSGDKALSKKYLNTSPAN